MTHCPWCWERLRAEGEEGLRGWDAWMASLMQWTRTWANSRRCWARGRPDVLQSMGSQRVGQDRATEQQHHFSQTSWAFFSPNFIVPKFAVVVLKKNFLLKYNTVTEWIFFSKFATAIYLVPNTVPELCHAPLWKRSLSLLTLKSDEPLRLLWRAKCRGSDTTHQRRGDKGTMASTWLHAHPGNPATTLWGSPGHVGNPICMFLLITPAKVSPACDHQFENTRVIKDASVIQGRSCVDASVKDKTSTSS